MVAASPPACLFYDPGCGPCTLFARVSEWASRSRLRATPFDGEEATRELGDLSEEVRYSYAHLVDTSGRTSGADIMSPLVGLTIGLTGGRVARSVPSIDHGLRWLYQRFWNYRRTRGCAAPDRRTTS